jgi:hypothetical protein
MVASGVDTIQLGIQEHPQGSSSATPPPSSFNMPPTEHAQALHRNLAAELIHSGARRSPLLPSRIRYPQESGTAVSMNDPFVTEGITLILLYRKDTRAHPHHWRQEHCSYKRSLRNTGLRLFRCKSCSRRLRAMRRSFKVSKNLTRLRSGLV